MSSTQSVTAPVSLDIDKRDLIYIASNVVSRDVTEGVVKLINKNGEMK